MICQCSYCKGEKPTIHPYAQYLEVDYIDRHGSFTRELYPHGVDMKIILEEIHTKDYVTNKTKDFLSPDDHFMIKCLVIIVILGVFMWFEVPVSLR